MQTIEINVPIQSITGYSSLEEALQMQNKKTKKNNKNHKNKLFQCYNNNNNNNTNNTNIWCCLYLSIVMWTI